MSEKRNIELFQFAPKEKLRGWKSWMGKVAVDDLGRIFLPSLVIGMGAMEAVLCAGFDSTPVVTHKKLVMLPVEWLIKERPECKEVIEKVIKRVKEQHWAEMKMTRTTEIFWL